MKTENYKVFITFNGTIGRERKSKFQFIDLYFTQDRSQVDMNTHIELAKTKLENIKHKNDNSTYIINFCDNESDGRFNTTMLMPSIKQAFIFKKEV